MPTHEEHILRILSEATEPLFPSEIADRLNRELVARAACTSTEIVWRLNGLSEEVAQMPDGRWMPKRRML